MHASKQSISLAKLVKGVSRHAKFVLRKTSMSELVVKIAAAPRSPLPKIQARLIRISSSDWKFYFWNSHTLTPPSNSA